MLVELDSAVLLITRQVIVGAETSVELGDSLDVYEMHHILQKTMLVCNHQPIDYRVGEVILVPLLFSDLVTFIVQIYFTL